MTVTLEQSISNIEERIEELRDQADEQDYQLNNFCDGCGEVQFQRFYEEYWGAPVSVVEQICEKGESSCERLDEYEELEAQFEETLRNISVLESMARIYREGVEAHDTKSNIARSVA